MKKDTMGGLVPLSQNQLYPRMAKPGDFMPAPPDDDKDMYAQLKAVPMNMEDPRCTQDAGMGKSGAGTPSEWGTAKGMNPMQSKSRGTSVSADAVGVDFKTGQHAAAYTK